MKISMPFVGMAFVAGIVAPFVLSVISVMLSFDIGVKLAKVLIPFSSMDQLGDNTIILLNGILYGFVALVVLILRDIASARKK